MDFVLNNYKIISTTIAIIVFIVLTVLLIINFFSNRKKTESTYPDPSHYVPSHNDPPYPNIPQPDTPQPDTPQPETPQSETPQSETPQSETPQNAYDFMNDPNISQDCKNRSKWIYDNRNNPKYKDLQEFKINSLYDAYRWMSCEPKQIDANGNRFCSSFSGNDCNSLINNSNNNVDQPTEPTQISTNKITEFPTDTDNIVFSIHYKNSTNTDILVWLDDQPFCNKPNNNTDAPCRQGSPVLPSTNWNLNLAKFYIVKKVNGKWDIKAITAPQRKQLLHPGEIWRIVPPTGTDGKPYWCFDQGVPICFDKKNNPSWCKDDNYKKRRVCPGVGAWVTPANKNMPAIKEVTKFEYNINNGVLWFDVSAVDGINCKTIAEYTGCKQKFKSCLLDLSTCPRKSIVDGVNTCPSPKTWSDIENCGTNNFGYPGISAKNLAGCPYGAEPNKGECHKWWANNKCAQDWIKWLQYNPSGEKCDQYAWAYNEMVYKNGDGFDKNYNPCELSSDGKCKKVRTNLIEPLINCQINKGSLNIDIIDIMM